MSHSIEIPYAPGATVWVAASVVDNEYSPCPDCGGGKNVVILTNAGMYEVPCETCSAGWEGPRGWVQTKHYSRQPKLVVLGAPRLGVFDGGKIEYVTDEGIRAVDDLFETKEACAAHCAKVEAEHREALERQQWNKSKHGRTETARHLAWHRKELARAERDVAYHAQKVKGLSA